MKLDFRIDFGYQYLYSRRHYHPVYVWDGSLSCEGGRIDRSFRLDYPVIWFGPGLSAREIPLDGPRWSIRTKRGVAGVRFETEVGDGAVFSFETESFSVKFSAAELREKGRLEYPVGPKYLGCSVIVTLDRYLWFRPAPAPGESAIESYDMGLPVHNWHRMDLAWLMPGQDLTFKVNIPEPSHDYEETLFHTQAMIAKEYDPEKNTQVSSYIELALLCDGEIVKKYKKYYRYHDYFIQFLEDDWVRVQLSPGEHVITIRNLSSLCFCPSRIKWRQCGYDHGQLSLPEWVLKGEEFFGRVFAARPDRMTVALPDGEITLDCEKGWNEFRFRLDTPGMAKFRAGTEAEVEVIDAEPEADPVRVGYDMTAVPHDGEGFMDWLLDYTARTRLGNYIMFRSFKEGNVPDELLTRWGEFCRDHGLWVSACTDYMSGALVRASGNMFSDCGLHEYPGKVYAYDPAEPYASDDMETAARKYIEDLKIEIDRAHTVADCTAFGDASGGIRYSFLAGADFVRAETMVGNTSTLLTQARPAAEALGKGRWGVHIAIQHNFQPYHENHLGQYFLSLMQPWMMGANTIYEEDCLFILTKEERQCWDDLLTKGKRDMTRRFFKFVSTHPRRGRNVRKIAFLEGRWAAPFNGFICDSEQDPHYSVWGLFGNSSPEWGHGQPEKSRQVLDVLMPGASTHPLRQRFDMRRFFFTGTPYGDFDCVPVEASADYLKNYGLILNLGWHTANEEDEAKLTEFVRNGGVILTGIPQFSRHKKREFLRDMEDLDLIRDGDLTELCGIRVKGRGKEYSGQWNAAGRESYVEPALSALPSDDVMEDGRAYLAEVELSGAEVVAWDSFTGEPMLVRNRVGDGYVYTLTLWAYPGHELFREFSAAIVARLAEETLTDTYVEDPSGEVFWTRYVEDEGETLMLLNTDWTEKGNEKAVVIRFDGKSYCTSVKEREALILTLRDGDVSEERVTL